MSRSRPFRRFAACLAIAVLLFSQGLVAAHACMVAAPAAAAAPCEEGDAAARDALCKAHCERGTQSVDQAKPLGTPVLGAPLAVLRAEDLAPPRAGPPAGPAHLRAPPGTPPPLRLHQRLRI
jgi:hypothetical protein